MVSVMVTGGTGVLGQKAVPRLLAGGHEVAVLTRRRAVPLPDGVRRMAGNLAAGQGLDAAARVAEVIVHLATRPFRPARVDAGGTRALLDAVKRCGGDPHLVYVSIVGVERIPWSYYRRKREAELRRASFIAADTCGGRASASGRQPVSVGVVRCGQPAAMRQAHQSRPAASKLMSSMSSWLASMPPA